MFELPGEQEAQQVSGRLVGPVHVLDDQDDRLLLRQGLEQDEEHLEQAGTRRPGICARRRGTEIGQQHAELARGLARQQPGHLRGAARADQLAQRRGERRVGQAARAQLDTAPRREPGRGPHRRGELCDQPRLAASGFRAGQHRAWGTPAASSNAPASSVSSAFRPAKTGLTKPAAILVMMPAR